LVKAKFKAANGLHAIMEIISMNATISEKSRSNDSIMIMIMISFFKKSRQGTIL